MNIYDFIGHHHKLMVTPTGSLDCPLPKANSIDVDRNGPTSPPILKVMVPTKFPGARHLGIYSERTGRVYDKDSAYQSGMLHRLLRRIGPFFTHSARVAFCEELDQKYKATRKLDQVDILLLRLIRDGHVYYDTAGYVLQRKSYGEPELVATYPFCECPCGGRRLIMKVAKHCTKRPCAECGIFLWAVML